MSSAEPPTVLFVEHGQHLGGSGVSLSVILRTLGPRIRRVVAAPDGPAVRRIDEQGGIDRWVAIPPVSDGGTVSPLALVRSSLLLALRTRGERVTAIHANGLLDLFLALPTALVRRARVVVWLHDADPSDRRATSALPITRLIRNRVRWVAVSEAAAATAANAGVAPLSSIAVVPNPIEATSVVAVRVPSAMVRVGFLGTDSPRKGFDLLPAIARSLDPAQARLLVFSRRHEEAGSEISAAWDELLALPAVEIRGRVDDVKEAYGSSDVILCPSRSESFCRVAAEAMLNGLPVVGSDLPAVREVLVDGAAGVLVRPGDAEAFARAVDSLVTDPDRREMLGSIGREGAGAFSPERVAEMMRDLYFGARG